MRQRAVGRVSCVAEHMREVTSSAGYGRVTLVTASARAGPFVEQRDPYSQYAIGLNGMRV